MTPAELRCPTCVAVLARIRRVHVDVGRPFEECTKCRTYVRRPATNEWDLLGPLARVSWVCARSAPFLVLGLVPALAYWSLRSGPPERRTLVALLAAAPLLVAFFPLPSVLHAIRRSRARMADPMYRARLVEFSRRRA